MTRSSSAAASPSWRRLALPAGVVVVVVVLAVLATVSGGSESAGSGAAAPASDQTAAQEQLPTLADRVPGDPMALGDADAPVVMVMWSDFQCPFCGRFARETQPALVERYVDTGVLRLEWRDFPYIGEESVPAAVAGRAAAAQGRFWQFSEVVYGQERRPRSSDYDAAHLREYAEQAGLDLARYDADVAAQVGLAEVQADMAAATGLGVAGTPTFLVNGSPVTGAQPLDSFVAVIEQAAAAAGRPAP